MTLLNSVVDSSVVQGMLALGEFHRFFVNRCISLLLHIVDGLKHDTQRELCICLVDSLNHQEQTLCNRLELDIYVTVH